MGLRAAAAEFGINLPNLSEKCVVEGNYQTIKPVANWRGHPPLGHERFQTPNGNDEYKVYLEG